VFAVIARTPRKQGSRTKQAGGRFPSRLECRIAERGFQAAAAAGEAERQDPTTAIVKFTARP
jgi:hypothetical protein